MICPGCGAPAHPDDESCRWCLRVLPQDDEPLEVEAEEVVEEAPRGATNSDRAAVAMAVAYVATGAWIGWQRSGVEAVFFAIFGGGAFLLAGGLSMLVLWLANARRTDWRITAGVAMVWLAVVGVLVALPAVERYNERVALEERQRADEAFGVVEWYQPSPRNRYVWLGYRRNLQHLPPAVYYKAKP